MTDAQMIKALVKKGYQVKKPNKTFHPDFVYIVRIKDIYDRYHYRMMKTLPTTENFYHVDIARLDVTKLEYKKSREDILKWMD